MRIFGPIAMTEDHSQNKTANTQMPEAQASAPTPAATGVTSSPPVISATPETQSESAPPPSNSATQSQPLPLVDPDNRNALAPSIESSTADNTADKSPGETSSSNDSNAPTSPPDAGKAPWQTIGRLWRQRPGSTSASGQDSEADPKSGTKPWDRAWQKASQQLNKIGVPVKQFPLQAVAQKAAQDAKTAAQKASGTATDWFNVSEDRIAEILATVRAELPTTEAILIGKPQTGKSSIVRGITGVSPEIIGQGYRPHTEHTERYAYPSAELPLLLFTDTVGLGDASQSTDEILAELTTELEAEGQGARILILTVKINDFATDSLRTIAQTLRQTYPQIPVLLAVTCLHELYPNPQDDHPAYPPTFESITRAWSAIEEDFAGLYDQAVLLDFTLEEDGYTPAFYGLEPLRDRLADLLPEAEARAIEQLLNEQKDASAELGNLYRDVGRRYMSAFSIIAATLAAVPLPFATMPVLTALQVSMVGLLGKLYGQTLTSAQAGGIVSTIAGSFLAQAIGRELIKFIPIFGSVVAASWAAAYTWALGESACVYFGDLMGGKTPDPEKIQGVMRSAFSEAQTRFKQASKS